mmetsp:Transcript_33750/g.54446  ORF Transcript_33750/g.54446 Transcript_33750/m.54446 type:complete len:80 (+) Transcript_33750:1299-1538(+)
MRAIFTCTNARCSVTGTCVFATQVCAATAAAGSDDNSTCEQTEIASNHFYGDGVGSGGSTVWCPQAEREDTSHENEERI